jgi:hypothetical protein
LPPDGWRRRKAGNDDPAPRRIGSRLVSLPSLALALFPADRCGVCRTGATAPLLAPALVAAPRAAPSAMPPPLSRNADGIATTGTESMVSFSILRR